MPSSSSRESATESLLLPGHRVFSRSRRVLEEAGAPFRLSSSLRCENDPPSPSPPLPPSPSSLGTNATAQWTERNTSHGTSRQRWWSPAAGLGALIPSPARTPQPHPGGGSPQSPWEDASRSWSGSPHSGALMVPLVAGRLRDAVRQPSSPMDYCLTFSSARAQATAYALCQLLYVSPLLPTEEPLNASERTSSTSTGTTSGAAPSHAGVVSLFKPHPRLPASISPPHGPPAPPLPSPPSPSSAPSLLIEMGPSHTEAPGGASFSSFTDGTSFYAYYNWWAKVRRAWELLQWVARATDQYRNALIRFYDDQVQRCQFGEAEEIRIGHAFTTDDDPPPEKENNAGEDDGGRASTPMRREKTAGRTCRIPAYLVDRLQHVFELEDEAAMSVESLRQGLVAALVQFYLRLPVERSCYDVFMTPYLRRRRRKELLEKIAADLQRLQEHRHHDEALRHGRKAEGRSCSSSQRRGRHRSHSSHHHRRRNSSHPQTSSPSSPQTSSAHPCGEGREQRRGGPAPLLDGVTSSIYVTARKDGNRTAFRPEGAISEKKATMWSTAIAAGVGVKEENEDEVDVNDQAEEEEQRRLSAAARTIVALAHRRAPETSCRRKENSAQEEPALPELLSQTLVDGTPEQHCYPLNHGEGAMKEVLLEDVESGRSHHGTRSSKPPLDSSQCPHHPHPYHRRGMKRYRSSGADQPHPSPRSTTPPSSRGIHSRRRTARSSSRSTQRSSPHHQRKEERGGPSLCCHGAPLEGIPLSSIVRAATRYDRSFTGLHLLSRCLLLVSSETLMELRRAAERSCEEGYFNMDGVAEDSFLNFSETAGREAEESPPLPRTGSAQSRSASYARKPPCASSSSSHSLCNSASVAAKSLENRRRVEEEAETRWGPSSTAGTAAPPPQRTRTFSGEETEDEGRGVQDGGLAFAADVRSPTTRNTTSSATAEVPDEKQERRPGEGRDEVMTSPASDAYTCEGRTVSEECEDVAAEPHFSPGRAIPEMSGAERMDASPLERYFFLVVSPRPVGACGHTNPCFGNHQFTFVYCKDPVEWYELRWRRCDTGDKNQEDEEEQRGSTSREESGDEKKEEPGHPTTRAGTKQRKCKRTRTEIQGKEAVLFPEPQQDFEEDAEGLLHLTSVPSPPLPHSLPHHNRDTAMLHEAAAHARRDAALELAEDLSLGAEDPRHPLQPRRRRPPPRATPPARRRQDDGGRTTSRTPGQSGSSYTTPSRSPSHVKAALTQERAAPLRPMKRATSPPLEGGACAGSEEANDEAQGNEGTKTPLMEEDVGELDDDGETETDTAAPPASSTAFFTLLSHYCSRLYTGHPSFRDDAEEEEGEDDDEGQDGLRQGETVVASPSETTSISDPTVSFPLAPDASPKRSAEQTPPVAVAQRRTPGEGGDEKMKIGSGVSRFTGASQSSAVPPSLWDRKTGPLEYRTTFPSPYSNSCSISFPTNPLMRTTGFVLTGQTIMSASGTTVHGAVGPLMRPILRYLPALLQKKERETAKSGEAFTIDPAPQPGRDQESCSAAGVETTADTPPNTHQEMREGVLAASSSSSSPPLSPPSFTATPSAGDLLFCEELCARLHFWHTRGAPSDSSTDEDEEDRDDYRRAPMSADETHNMEGSHISSPSSSCRRRSPSFAAHYEDYTIKAAQEEEEKKKVEPEEASQRRTPTMGEEQSQRKAVRAEFHKEEPPPPSAQGSRCACMSLPLRLLSLDVGTIHITLPPHPNNSKARSTGRRTLDEDDYEENEILEPFLRGLALLRHALQHCTHAVVCAVRESRAHGEFHDEIHPAAPVFTSQQQQPARAQGSSSMPVLQDRGTLSRDGRHAGLDYYPLPHDPHTSQQTLATVNWLQGDDPATDVEEEESVCQRQSKKNFVPLPSWDERQWRVERLKSEFRLARSSRLDLLLVHQRTAKPLATLTLGKYTRYTSVRAGDADYRGPLDIPYKEDIESVVTSRSDEGGAESSSTHPWHSNNRKSIMKCSRHSFHYHHHHYSPSSMPRRDKGAEGDGDHVPPGANLLIPQTVYYILRISPYVFPLLRHLREEKVLMVDLDRTLVDNAVTPQYGVPLPTLFSPHPEPPTSAHRCSLGSNYVETDIPSACSAPHDNNSPNPENSKGKERPRPSQPQQKGVNSWARQMKRRRSDEAEDGAQQGHEEGEEAAEGVPTADGKPAAELKDGAQRRSTSIGRMRSWIRSRLAPSFATPNTTGRPASASRLRRTSSGATAFPPPLSQSSTPSSSHHRLFSENPSRSSGAAPSSSLFEWQGRISYDPNSSGGRGVRSRRDTTCRRPFSSAEGGERRPEEEKNNLDVEASDTEEEEERVSEMISVRPKICRLLFLAAVQWGIPLVLVTKSSRARTMAVLDQVLDPYSILFPDRIAQVITADDSWSAPVAGQPEYSSSGSMKGKSTRSTAADRVVGGALVLPSASLNKTMHRSHMQLFKARKSVEMALQHFSYWSSSIAAPSSLRVRGSLRFPPTVWAGGCGVPPPAIARPRCLAVLDDSPQVWCEGDWPLTVAVQPYTLNRIDPTVYTTRNGYLHVLVVSLCFSRRSLRCVVDLQTPSAAVFTWPTHCACHCDLRFCGRSKEDHVMAAMRAAAAEPSPLRTRFKPSLPSSPCISSCRQRHPCPERGCGDSQNGASQPAMKPSRPYGKPTITVVEEEKEVAIQKTEHTTRTAVTTPDETLFQQVRQCGSSSTSSSCSSSLNASGSSHSRRGAGSDSSSGSSIQSTSRLPSPISGSCSLTTSSCCSCSFYQQDTEKGAPPSKHVNTIESHHSHHTKSHRDVLFEDIKVPRCHQHKKDRKKKKEELIETVIARTMSPTPACRDHSTIVSASSASSLRSPHHRSPESPTSETEKKRDDEPPPLRHSSFSISCSRPFPPPPSSSGSSAVKSIPARHENAKETTEEEGWKAPQKVASVSRSRPHGRAQPLLTSSSSSSAFSMSNINSLNAQEQNGVHSHSCKLYHTSAHRTPSHKATASGVGPGHVVEKENVEDEDSVQPFAEPIKETFSKASLQSRTRRGLRLHTAGDTQESLVIPPRRTPLPTAVTAVGGAFRTAAAPVWWQFLPEEEEWRTTPATPPDFELPSPLTTQTRGRTSLESSNSHNKGDTLRLVEPEFSVHTTTVCGEASCNASVPNKVVVLAEEVVPSHHKHRSSGGKGTCPSSESPHNDQTCSHSPSHSSCPSSGDVDEMDHFLDMEEEAVEVVRGGVVEESAGWMDSSDDSASYRPWAKEAEDVIPL